MLAGCASTKPDMAALAPTVTIADPGCVTKTFPGYFRALDGLR